MNNQQPLIAIVGATATGKTDLSIGLAKAIGGEIINADSMQFYRGMDIGTAKVSEEEQQGIPHHLVNIFDLHVEASVAAFQSMARQKISEIRARGSVPILVGGSGLYVRAAIDVLEFPPTDGVLRQELTDEAHTHGIERFKKELQISDPQSAAQITDERRIIRAIEVIRLTGRPFSAFMPRREYHPDNVPVVQLGLTFERSLLHERIEQRVKKMLELGWLDEIKQLAQHGLESSPTASKAIGYRQMLQYLDAKISLEEATESTVVATRRFARRQETWFKADPRVHWIDGQTSDQLDHALMIIDTQRTHSKW